MHISITQEIYGVSKDQEQWLKDKWFTVENSFNTYNWDCNLSQTLQWTYVVEESSNDWYVLLQVHQWCDVRGGYTDAKMFYLWNDQRMPSENVSWNVTMKNWEEVYVSNWYDGVRLRFDVDSE